MKEPYKSWYPRKNGIPGFFSKALHIAIIFNINYLISFNGQKIITQVALFIIPKTSIYSFSDNDPYEITEIKFPIMGRERETHFSSAKSPFPDFITYGGRGNQKQLNQT